MSARQLFRSLFYARYTPLIEVCVSSSRIRDNLHTFQRMGHIAVAPVLKSNAYGHGLMEVAGIVDKENIPFICIDSFFEARALRHNRIRSPLLILGYTTFGNIAKSKLIDVSFSITGIDELRRLSRQLRSRRSFHLEIDTGMHRQGIAPKELVEAIKLIKSNRNIVIEGAYSHFADADTPHSPLTEKQILVWNNSADICKTAFPDIRHLHCAATAGSAYHDTIEATVMRLGIGLYGFAAGSVSLPLQPALSLRTRIASVHALQPGESIGYNSTFTAAYSMRIAAIPVGYFEGLDRRLSNKGSVQVGKSICPIIGNISMNMASIDITETDTELDSEVIVISDTPEDQNSIESMAKLCHTIPYELLVHIPAHLKRVVY